MTFKNWGSDVEMCEILPRDWNLKPIFIQKWASVDMNWGFNNSHPALIPGIARLALMHDADSERGHSILFMELHFMS